MTKYRQKPVVIEAEQYTLCMEDGFSCIPFVMTCKFKSTNKHGMYFQCHECTLDIPKKPFISSLEGNMYIDDGDWIITCENGVRYPIKADIFEETYELVE